MSDPYKIAVVGAGGVGKSAFIIQYLQGTFMADYDPTIEDSYRKQDSISFNEGTPETVYLEILDTAGQEEYSALRDDYMRSCNGFLLLFSLIERNSFVNIDEFRDHILRVKDRDDVPMVLVGNKCDLTEDLEVTAEDATRKSNLWEVPLFLASAKTAINVHESFHEVARLMRAEFDRKKAPAKAKKKKSGCSLL